jgi:hypothetical protein
MQKFQEKLDKEAEELAELEALVPPPPPSHLFSLLLLHSGLVSQPGQGDGGAGRD